MENTEVLHNEGNVLNFIACKGNFSSRTSWGTPRCGSSCVKPFHTTLCHMSRASVRHRSLHRLVKHVTGSTRPVVYRNAAGTPNLIDLIEQSLKVTYLRSLISPLMKFMTVELKTKLEKTVNKPAIPETNKIYNYELSNPRMNELNCVRINVKLKQKCFKLPSCGLHRLFFLSLCLEHSKFSLFTPLDMLFHLHSIKCNGKTRLKPY